MGRGTHVVIWCFPILICYFNVLLCYFLRLLFCFLIVFCYFYIAFNYFFSLLFRLLSSIKFRLRLADSAATMGPKASKVAKIGSNPAFTILDGIWGIVDAAITLKRKKHENDRRRDLAGENVQQNVQFLFECEYAALQPAVEYNALSGRDEQSATTAAQKAAHMYVFTFLSRLVRSSLFHRESIEQYLRWSAALYMFHYDALTGIALLGWEDALEEEHLNATVSLRFWDDVLQNHALTL